MVAKQEFVVDSSGVWSKVLSALQHTQVHHTPNLENFHPCTTASQQDDTTVPVVGNQAQVQLHDEHKF
jgi:hypothetical protein